MSFLIIAKAIKTVLHSGRLVFLSRGRRTLFTSFVDLVNFLFVFVLFLATSSNLVGPEYTVYVYCSLCLATIVVFCCLFLNCCC